MSFQATFTSNTNNQRTYVLKDTTSSPMGPYTYAGQMNDPTNLWAIDPTVLNISNNNYLIWSGWSGTTNVAQNLYIAPIQNMSGNNPLYSTFDAEPVAATDVLVKYTYYGDTNLDGKVDGSDYSRIDSGFLNQLTGWFNGDFNYDNIVNGSDYTLIDNTFNRQGTHVTTEFATTESIINTPVPEPAGAVLALAVSGLLGRRSKSQRPA